MRLLTVFIGFCYGIILQAQVEYSNTYVYPLPQDNDNAFNIYLLKSYDNIYTIPYTGGMYKIDNQNEKIFCSKDLNMRRSIKSINKDDSTFEILINKKSLVYKKDSITKVLNIPDDINIHNNVVYDDNLYFLSIKNDKLYVYNGLNIKLVKNLNTNYSYSFCKINESSFLVKNKGDKVYLIELDNFKIKKEFSLKNFYSLWYFSDSSIIYINNNKDFIKKHNNGEYKFIGKEDNAQIYNQWALRRINSKTIKITNIETERDYFIDTDSYIFNFIVDEKNKAVYLGTGQRPMKSFLYINKIPNTFDNVTSNSCFTLAEDNKGNIWAGSYNKYLSVIKKDTIVSKQVSNLKFLIGSISLGDTIYFTTEGDTEGGIWGMTSESKPFLVKDNSKKRVQGFYLFKSSKNKIYYGTSKRGLWEIDEKDLKSNNGKWSIIDENQTDKLVNILTITEDKYGRIYFAGTLGIGIYKDNKTKYFLAKDSVLPKPICSLTDSYGTVWFGGKGGVYYITPNDKEIESIDLKKLNHPFLNHKDTFTTALSINQNYLIVANQNRMLALDLKKFHESKEINIKYLTSQETNFTSTTEQNTTLTAKDGSVWFSTLDMIYRWDFNTWLKLPKPKIKPKLQLITKDNNIELIKAKKTRLSSFDNTFKITLNYSTPDKLPRYIQYAFQNKNDSIEWSEINTKSEFNFQNLKAGDYTFHLKIFELNGSTSYYKYFIVIPKFLHELWYFWLIVGAVIITIVSYIIYTHQNAKTKLANWELEKEKVNKQLSQLQLTSISNQFRPHFLLNTFNSLGAYLESGSYEETVLDTMGKSINILFSTAKKEKNYHSLKKEWQLVKNLIKIYQLVYIKDLKTKVPSKKQIKLIEDLNIPFGILQIPIENALLHGLHNKPTPPYLLKVLLENNESEIIFRIIDNGVGIQKAGTLSNVRKNGTGLKNLNKIIAVFNQYNYNKIIFAFIENPQKEGTEIKIIIPKNFNYEINS
ncbi:histidine kinase [Weeksellaceae bacterium TAE3-ERU29]|nr:histidine kinase [Weeksellaceae bacterium TAE3-ERU29]